MKIFVINLKTSVQRRQIMEKQLAKLNIPYEFFEAVKGADVPQEDIPKYYNMEYYNARPSYFTPGLMGCTMSHYFLYKKIAEEKVDVAIILEDDMVLNANFEETVLSLSRQIRKDEAIMLFYQSYNEIKLSSATAMPVAKNYTLYQIANIDILRSTGGYMITCETAQAMAQKIRPFASYPDDWRSFYERKMLNGIRAVYPFVLDNSYEPTTISPHTKNAGLLKKVIAFSEANKIFPIYQLLKMRRKKYTASTRRCVIADIMPVDIRMAGA